MCVLSLLPFNIVFAEVLLVALQRFGEDAAILENLVHLQERPTAVGLESSMDYVLRAVWGMLYTDDTCIVSLSPHGLAKMMEMIVDMCHAFGLTVSEKTETLCMPAPHKPTTTVDVEAAGQRYKQAYAFTPLGGSITEIPDISTKIARRTRACWLRIRRYQRELYDRPVIELDLKTRMVETEAVEALLYGCGTWTTRQDHYKKLRTVHHRILPPKSQTTAFSRTTTLSS